MKPSFFYQPDRSGSTTSLGRRPAPHGHFLAGLLFLLAALATGLTPAIAQSPANNILYVNQDVSGGNQNGSSWENALPELADALLWAREQHDNNTASWGENNPLQIWVATGMYKPLYNAADGQYTTDGDRDNAFVLVPNVQLYGGFAGNETNITARDWVNNPTTLSGDLGTPGDNSDNAYHVLISADDAGNALLDGFTVTAGNADGNGTIPVNGQNIGRNRGGGMVNIESSPVLTNVAFSANQAASNGGGMWNVDSSPTLTNVTFSGNSATSGGGMSNIISSSPVLTNVIIWGNQAGGDDASASASIFNSNSTPSISYSLIANSGGSGNWDTDLGDDGGNNMDVDPQFIEPADPEHEDFLRLANTSPAINMGDPGTDLSIFPGGPGSPTDLAGNPRVFAGTVERIDIGAYEFQGDPFGTITPGDGNIVYVNQNVDPGAEGYNASGDSWVNALPELRDALSWAETDWDATTNGILQIWVAGGVYTSTDDSTDRTATFRLVNNVEVYGGFAGNENNLESRNWEAHPTILSGDIDGNDDAQIITDPENEINGDNSYHVVTGSGTDNTARLDGFTITAGLANGGTTNDWRGGGMVNDGGSPTLTNVTFSGNSAGGSGGGGGMYNHSNSSPVLTNVAFSGNSATSGGGMVNHTNSSPTLTNVTFSGNSGGNSGGMLNNNSSPTLTNVTFSGNSAGNSGGGMFNVNSSPTLTNVAFSANQAASNGGGMLNIESSPVLTNVTFSGNSTGGGGGGMSNHSNSSPTLTNVIIWGNQAGGDDASASASIFNNNSTPSISYSLIANSGGSGNWDTDLGDDGGNNMDVDPQFIEPADPDAAPTTAGDLRLANTSPAINAGNPGTDLSIFPDGPGSPTDLAGNPRVYDLAGGGVIDIGAYEFQGAPLVPATQVTLTEAAGEGWRFMTSPVAGETFENFLAPLWTQGIPGSDNPGANTPNIYRLDQDEYQWIPLSGMQEEIGPGTPFIVWVFEDDNNDGTITPEEEFDKTLTSTGDWLPLDGSFEYSGLDFDSNQEPDGDSHFLLANPHPISLDFCEFAKEQVAEAVWFWDPAAGGGNGDYLDLNCTTDEVHIAPFQAFWVRTLAENPELSIPEEAYLTGQADGYFKAPEPSARSGRSDGWIVTLNTQSQDGVFSDRTRILFSEEGTLAMDRYDAPKLSPEGLAPRWLSFHTLDEAGRAYAFRSLSADFGEQVSIPLDIATTQAGVFELSWSLPEHATLHSYWLRDNVTGNVTELTEGGRYRFEVEPDQAITSSEHSGWSDDSRPGSLPSGSGSLYSSVHGKWTDEAPRFTLTVSAGQTNTALPLAVSLLPNYPNPFNPVTQIRFELPQPSRVSLEVYDILGRRVATLVDETMGAGVQTATFDARGLASGVYLTRLQVDDSPAGPVVQVHKMTLIRRE